jgi:hypothetical protein
MPTHGPLFLLAAPTLVLSGCAQVFYAPNVANAPLLRQSREVRVAGYVGGGDGVDLMAQGSLAAAVGPRLALYSSGYFARGASTAAINRRSGAGTAWDAGLGYYRFGERRFGIEAIGALQYGRGHNTEKEVSRVTYGFLKPYAQINAGYRGRWFEAVVAQRVGRLAYHGIRDTNDDFIRPQIFADLLATSPSLLYEPSVSVRVGREPIKLAVDLGFTKNVSGTPLHLDDTVLTFSLQYSVIRR